MSSEMTVAGKPRFMVTRSEKVSPDLGGNVGGEVFADLLAGVGEAGVEQEARGFDAAGAEEDGDGALLMLVAVGVAVEDGGEAAGGVLLKAVDEGVGANLGAVADGGGEIGDVHGGFGARCGNPDGSSRG